MATQDIIIIISTFYNLVLMFVEVSVMPILTEATTAIKKGQCLTRHYPFEKHNSGIDYLVIIIF